ncbi:platelet-activating factor acetylhydrolase-like [Ptychodera flava]|uniref:platelet-activating factor acetylhydrolase-like n=1 Tax=Ptychodera flava TaxID=63121 RepID=UPI00396A51FA
MKKSAVPVNVIRQYLPTLQTVWNWKASSRRLPRRSCSYARTIAMSGSIPTGRGPYNVGCTDVMTGGLPNVGCFLRLYYPTSLKTANKQLENVGIPWLPRREYADTYIVAAKTKYMDDDFKVKVTREDKEKLMNCKVPVFWNGSVLPSNQKASFPVVIYSHGLGSCRLQSSTVSIDLVSQGFVVAALEHRDNSAGATYFLRKSDDGTLSEEWLEFILSLPSKEEFPLRNSQVKVRARESSRALDLLENLNKGDHVENLLDQTSNSLLKQFKGRLDVSRAVVMGHSFGGSTTVQSLFQDRRFRCGIGLDSWIFPIDVGAVTDKIQQPLLFINDERFQWGGNIIRMNRLLIKNPPAERKLITIMGTDHDNQTDLPFILDYWKTEQRLDPAVAMAIQNDAAIAFISKHTGLDYDKSAESILNGDHPHVIQGTNLKLKPKAPKSKM